MVNSIALLGKGLNNSTWKPIIDFLKKNSISPKLLSSHLELDNSFEFAILLGYDKIIPEEYLSKVKYGLILFHSSDLPKGRGWAPVFYTMNNEKKLVQTMLYAGKEADLGNVLAKAYYSLDGNEIEAEVKHYDDELTLLLIENFLIEIFEKKPIGTKQNIENATWWAKRRPKDSEISSEAKVSEIFDKLRSVPKSAPCFFTHKGRTYKIELSNLNEEDYKKFDKTKAKTQKLF